MVDANPDFSDEKFKGDESVDIPSGFIQPEFISDQDYEDSSPSKIIHQPSVEYEASDRLLYRDPSAVPTETTLNRKRNIEQVDRVTLQYANGYREKFDDIQDFSELTRVISYPTWLTKFATKRALERLLFNFDGNKSTAKSMTDKWSSVTSILRSTNGRKIGIIFYCESNARFGICAYRYNDGYAGKQKGSWGWSCDGSAAYQEGSKDYDPHDLGDLTRKEIRMIYDGCNKRLTISCGGREWNHQDLDWPTEAFFVFSLEKRDQFIELRPSELARPKRAQSDLVVFRYSNEKGESYYISNQSSFEEALRFSRDDKDEQVTLSVIDNYQAELKSLQMVKKPTRQLEDFDRRSPQLVFYLNTEQYRPMHGSTKIEAIQVITEFNRLLIRGVTDRQLSVILAYLAEALQSTDEFEESEMAIERVRDISIRNNDDQSLALSMIISAVSRAMLGKNDDMDLLENSLDLIPEDEPETKVRVLIKIAKRKFSKAKQTKSRYEKLEQSINNEEQSQAAERLRAQEAKLKDVAEQYKATAAMLLDLVEDERLKLQFLFLEAE